MLIRCRKVCRRLSDRVCSTDINSFRVGVSLCMWTSANEASFCHGDSGVVFAQLDTYAGGEVGLRITGLAMPVRDTTVGNSTTFKAS